VSWFHSAVLFISLALAGLAASGDRAVAADLAAYRVADPNASFFAVDHRHNGSWPASQTAGLAAPLPANRCPEEPLARPIDYFVTIPAFYQDREGWREASAPFFAFEAQVTGFAANYVLTGEPVHAHCLLNLLASWADRGALLAFDYEGNHGQAWYAIQWATATAGLAYSIVRAEPSLSDGQRREVEDWLAAVVTKQIGHPGNPLSCCNNHHYWRGLQAAIVGVVAGDDRLFQYGIRAYRAALTSMNPDGSLPHEMDRGNRALHYQNFAILPLVFIAEIAARQGYDLYGVEIDGRDIHLAVGFLLRAIEDPAVLSRYTSEQQDLRFIDRREELNWLEPYHRRFPGSETAPWLTRLRPLSHNWTGGPSTLYFADLRAAAADRPNQALLTTLPVQITSE
jgi:poly(beta-D-mannuronate) lyase